MLAWFTMLGFPVFQEGIRENHGLPWGFLPNLDRYPQIPIPMQPCLWVWVLMGIAVGPVQAHGVTGSCGFMYLLI